MNFPCPYPGCKVVAESEAGLKRHMKAAGHSPDSSNEPTAASEPTSADEMLVDGRKRIKTIQDEFSARFPFLGLHFFSVEEFEKAKAGGTIRPYDGELTLASVRKSGGSGNGDFKLSGRMHVRTLEESFRKSFGLLVQVCVQKGGKGFYTSGEQDEQSLLRLNEHVQGDGYSRFDYSAHRK